LARCPDTPYPKQLLVPDGDKTQRDVHLVGDYVLQFERKHHASGGRDQAEKPVFLDQHQRVRAIGHGGFVKFGGMCRLSCQGIANAVFFGGQILPNRELCCQILSKKAGEQKPFFH